MPRLAGRTCPEDAARRSAPSASSRSAPAAFLNNFVALITCFAIATFCYAVASTMALSLPADLYRPRDVATVSGMGGSGAGVGTILSTFVIGVVADRFSFGPILMVASVVPLGAALLVLMLVRSPPHPRPTSSTPSNRCGVQARRDD